MSSESLRVEPLSDRPSPEWDLLVASGRLDALTTVEEIITLTQEKWDDEILGVAGAYAVYAAQSWDYLGTVVENLLSLRYPCLDVELLKIAAENRDSEELPNEVSDRLTSYADRGDVSLLRWGVPLALTLLDRTRNPSLEAWREALRKVRRTLSHASVWTAWTEPDDE